MKIIDEKGKLFGFINVVDLVVLIIVIALAAGIIVRLTSAKLNANGGNPLSEKKDIYVTLYAGTVVPEVADSLHEGDKLVANNAYTDAEIVSVKVEPAAFVGTNSDGIAVESKHPIWKDVTVVVKDKVNPSSVILKVGGQEARVGYSYILKTQTVEANSKIRGISFDAPNSLNSEADEADGSSETALEADKAEAEGEAKETTTIGD